VLIAAGIALTGILGAVAIFPVAILNMQKGVQVDAAAYIAPSALEQASAIGVTRPFSWLAYNGGSGTWNISGIPTTPPGGAPLPAMFGPFPATVVAPYASYCFDPRFAAECAPNTGVPGAFSPGLFPFKPSTGLNDVRMARYTLRRNPYSIVDFNPMQVSQARLLFKMSDDLIFERPTDLTAPAIQRHSDPMNSFFGNGGWIQDDNANDLRRNFMADYEYIITMTPNIRGVPYGQSPGFPPTYYALDGSTGIEPFPMENPTEYVMSAVVFYKRQTQLNTYIPSDPNDPEVERVTDVVAFAGNGVNGGDVTIQARNPAAKELRIHEGDYVMLSGNTYSISPFPPQRKFLGPRFQWYRVVAVNGDSYPNGGNIQRDLTLDGPDWPVNPATGVLVPPGLTQLTIVSGVVGVVSTVVELQ
jgi:hypothetical protein